MVPVTYAAKATAGLMERHSAALERITVLERALEKIMAAEVPTDNLDHCRARFERVQIIAEKALDG